MSREEVEDYNRGKVKGEGMVHLLVVGSHWLHVGDWGRGRGNDRRARARRARLLCCCRQDALLSA